MTRSTAVAVPPRPPAHDPVRTSRVLLDRLVVMGWPIAVLFLVGVLTVVQLAAAVDGRPAYLVGPLEVAQALVRDWAILLDASTVTLARLTAGFAIGAFCGVAVGLVSGALRTVEDLVDPVVSFSYPLPKIALYPIFAVWLGFTDSARVLVVAIVCFYPVYISALSGTRGIDPGLVRVALNAGASRRRAFLSVIVPAAMPRVMVGLQLGLAMGYAALFGAESLGGTSTGLGPRIMLALEGNPFSDVYASFVCFALLGVVTGGLLRFAGHIVTRGQQLTAVGHG